MKLGIIGSGMIVQEALPVLRELGIPIAALSGTPRSAETVRDLCARYEIPVALTDNEALLCRDDLDTVYVAVPNHLHFQVAREALLHGKHVILEKPLCCNLREAARLAGIARSSRRLLLEAVTTPLLATTRQIAGWLPRIGPVRVVCCNYSQYSRRYDAFCAGQLPPVFDPARAGGALMDLNVYNVHLVSELFGKPDGVQYRAHMERGIDTSGVLTLDYPDMQSVLIAAKDCAAPSTCVFQGTRGCILQEGPANKGGRVILRLNDGTEETKLPEAGHRMLAEFRAFRQIIDENNEAACEAALRHSLMVMDLLTRARESAGLRFPMD